MSEPQDRMPVKDAEVLSETKTSPSPPPNQPQGLEKRKPDFLTAPASVTALAALDGDRGVQIIEARTRILRTARQASIQATRPEDWVLFKDREDHTVGYLQDAGCNRIAPIWGITIFNLGKQEKIDMEGGAYMYIVSGDGYCKLTDQTLEHEEGGRSSTDDVAKELKGAEQLLMVRKCARANLDGRIIRELTGMGNVPLDELTGAAPTHNWANARKGKGFGTGRERADSRMGQGEIDMNAPVPVCEKCGSPMWDNRRDPNRRVNSPHFKCKKKGSDPNCDHAVWLKPVVKPATQPATAQSTAESKTAATTGAEQQTTTPASQDVGRQNEEKARLQKLIRAQYKSRKWDMGSPKQLEHAQQWLDAASLDVGNNIDQLPLESLVEIHEDLKKA